MTRFKHFSKYLAPLFCAAMLLSAALPVQASSLTSAQISAIVSLLQAFNADPAVVANVQAQLGGSSTPSQSCSDFTDVKYGDFDNNQGGRVSQLQTFLGIDSSTFGFGTYGRKTQAAWDSKCGGTILTPTQPITTPTVPTTQPPVTIVPNQSIFRAYEDTPGKAYFYYHLHDKYQLSDATKDSSMYTIYFGDGTSAPITPIGSFTDSCPTDSGEICTTPSLQVIAWHTYSTLGTYNARLRLNSTGADIATLTINIRLK